MLLFFHNGHPVAIVNNNLIRARLTTCLTCVGQFEALLDPTPAVPAFPPEWDPERAQDNIVVSKDRYSVYLLYWYKGTKVHILTQLRQADSTGELRHGECAEYLEHKRL